MRLLTVEIRVAVVGNVDAGKSTLLGVLTHGELDNGRGTHGIFCVASLDLEKEKSENTITKKRKPTLLDRLGLSSDRHGSRRILRALVGSCSSPVIVLFVLFVFFAFRLGAPEAVPSQARDGNGPDVVGGQRHPRLRQQRQRRQPTGTRLAR